MIPELRFDHTLLNLLVANKGHLLLSWSTLGKQLYVDNSIDEVSIIKTTIVGTAQNQEDLTKPNTNLSLGSDMVTANENHFIDEEFNPTGKTKYVLALYSSGVIIHTDLIVISASGSPSDPAAVIGEAKFAISGNIDNLETGVEIRFKTCFIKNDSIKQLSITKDGTLYAQSYVSVPMAMPDPASPEHAYFFNTSGVKVTPASDMATYTNLLNAPEYILIRYRFSNPYQGIFFEVTDSSVITENITSGNLIPVLKIEDITTPQEGKLYYISTTVRYYIFKRHEVILPQQPEIQEPNIATKMFPIGYFDYDPVGNTINVPIDATLGIGADLMNIDISLRDQYGNVTSWGATYLTTDIDSYIPAGSSIMTSKNLWVDDNNTALDGSVLQYKAEFTSIAGVESTIFDIAIERKSDQLEAARATGGFDLSALHSDSQTEGGVLTEKDFVSGPAHGSLEVRISSDPTHVQLYKQKLKSKDGCVTCR